LLLDNGHGSIEQQLIIDQYEMGDQSLRSLIIKGAIFI